MKNGKFTMSGAAARTGSLMKIVRIISGKIKVTTCM